MSAFKTGVAEGMVKVAVTGILGIMPLATGMGVSEAKRLGGDKMEGGSRGFIYGIPAAIAGSLAGHAIGGPHGANVGSALSRAGAGIVAGRHASGYDWRGRKKDKK